VAAAARSTFWDCQAVRKARAVVVTSAGDSGPVFTLAFWSEARVPSSAAAPPPYSA
jgi:hypothetical protein